MPNSDNSVGDATNNTGNGVITGNLAEASDPQVQFNNSAEGGRLKRGGQKFGALFKDAVLDCYVNLSSSPSLLMFYYFVWIVSLAESFALDKGPLEYWLAYLKTRAPTWTLGRWIQAFQVWVLRICIANKFTVIAFANFSMPYLYKPSNKNLYFLILITLVANFVFSVSVLEIIIMGQLWFLFTQLRDPRFKYIIVVTAAVIFVLPTTGILEYMAGPEKPGPAPTPTPKVKP